MSFNIALTGLSAVNEQLNTIGNNIANSGTVGFKSSRTDFGSLYAETQAMGVEVIGSTQSISQGGGALTTTNRTLDLAISGGGFFVTRASNGDVGYTRAGIFGTDKDSYITNSPASACRAIRRTPPATCRPGPSPTTCSCAPAACRRAPADALQLRRQPRRQRRGAGGGLRPAGGRQLQLHLHHQAVRLAGKEHTLTQYFVETADDNWDAHYYIDGASLGAAQPLAFDSAGVLAAPIGTVTLNAALTGGVAPLAIDLDYTGSSQYGSEFSVTSNRATGYAAGEQTGMAVERTVASTPATPTASACCRARWAGSSSAEGLENISGTAWTEKPPPPARRCSAPRASASTARWPAARWRAPTST
ncbi:Flagellar hook protein FlgE OS=Stutzerimonas stutzeri OX=316 GN=flgE PE=3 SV=1 [Stutzerimonas stutzeri]